MKIFKRKQCKRTEEPAFILVEIVVVLFIVSMGMLGVVSLLIQNIKGQDYNKNSIIANQLAQEGIELIRKTRDSNWKEEIDWLTGLSAGDYYMSYNDDVPQVLSNTSDAVLYFNGRYQHASGGNSGNGSPSFFSRVIKLEHYPDGDGVALLVKSQVNWREHGQTRSYYLETLLYDWK